MAGFTRTTQPIGMILAMRAPTFSEKESAVRKRLCHTVNHGLCLGRFVALADGLAKTRIFTPQAELPTRLPSPLRHTSPWMEKCCFRPRTFSAAQTCQEESMLEWWMGTPNS